MKLLFQSPNTPEIVIKAVQKVIDKLTVDCPFFPEVSGTLYVIVDTEKDKLQTKPTELAGLNEGFAHVESNYFLRDLNQNVFVNLMIIHHHNCVLAQLTEDELVGVILHELGHLINDSVDEPIPSVLKARMMGTPFHPDDAAKVKYQNALTRECYADHYARVHGFGNEVAIALTKYYQITSTSPTKMALERIAVLSAPTVAEMQGKVKILKNN